MASYHLSVEPISRTVGRSATAQRPTVLGLASSTSARTGYTTAPGGGVVHTEIVMPAGLVPPNRQAPWNAAEAEKRKEARVAREFEIALSSELDAKQRLALARARSCYA